MSFRALVVGGTNGIGYAMACRVAAANPASSSIIISGRNKPANIPHSNMEFRPLDATSMRQIKQFTDTLKQSHPSLDLLIMTQGVMSMAGRTETPEGIDRKMALHYYGRQLLVRELLPVLTPTAKVIIVLDGWLGTPTKLIWDDLDLKKNFSVGKAADHCMAMNDGMVQHWARLQKKTDDTRLFVHAFPGGVNTSLSSSVVPGILQGPVRVLGNIFLTSPDTCAERLLSGTDDRFAEAKTSGRYWSNIDSKGKDLTKKAVFTDDQMDKVATHTWEVVDAALAVKN